ncbi:hypothetical protein HBB16_05050 [Pseudonocardia sp. MCCB 268]|nr:hypothetical protein [Pseudonocardia cytotoxica]
MRLDENYVRPRRHGREGQLRHQMRSGLIDPPTVELLSGRTAPICGNGSRCSGWP